MQNIFHLTDQNSVHIFDIFIATVQVVNIIWNAQKLGWKYQTREFRLTQNKYV